MWFLQADTALKLFAAGILWTALAALAGRFGAQAKLNRFLVLVDIALIALISPGLAAFYVVYTLATYGLTCLAPAAARRKEAGRRSGQVLFVVLNILCVTPFLYLRASAVWTALPVLLTLVGFSYNMLKAVDGVYFAYYTGERLDLVMYANYMLFFPVLTAGPIMRYRDFVRCMDSPAPITGERLVTNVKRLIRGYFKKVVVLSLVSILLSRLAALPGHVWLSVLVCLVSYLLLWLDMSGYADIAIALGGCMGFTVAENFKHPLRAASFTQFWRNWHVSLTSWFKDYLYIPLGGSRKGKLRKQINRMIVFLVSGLWHGANMTFVVWGGLNGLFQVIGELLMPLRLKLSELLHIDRQSLGVKLVQIPVTFLLFAFSLIFFRSDTVGEALAVISSIIHVRNPWILFDGSLMLHDYDGAMVLPMTFFMGALLFSDIRKQRGIAVRKIILRQDAWFRWLVFAVSTATVLLFGVWGPGFSEANFIYFQF